MSNEAMNPPVVVLLEGDGIGPEIVGTTANILQQLVPELVFERPLHGAQAQARTGTSMPPQTQERCRKASAVLFGATDQHSREVLRFLRWGLATFANVRPAKTRTGVESKLVDRRPIDLVIVRENLEGEYPAREDQLIELRRRWPSLQDKLGRCLPHRGAFAVRVITEEGAERISRFAAQLAAKRRANGRSGKVSVVTKSNVLAQTDGLFRRIAQGVLDEAGIEHEHYHVDDACRRLVGAPHSFDVILTPNLYGDIMSDISAELVGGLGLAPSACIGEHHAYFESVHGSAPDIAGQGIANPLATILSASMMLEHLGYAEQAQRLEDAVDQLLRDRIALTPDLGGHARTIDVERAIVALVTSPRNTTAA